MKISKLIRSIFLIIILLCIWFFASKFCNPLFVPSPQSVMKNFIVMLKSEQLIKAIWYSFRRISIATCLAAAVSIPTGLMIYNIKIVRDFLNPIISVLRYIPVTAFYPLLIMWFGIDETMKIAFLFIATVVYMMPSVILTLNEVNPDLIDTGMTIGMNKLQIIYMIQLPYSLPGILNSFIMMFGIGWTYIAVAETINAKYGLGYIIQQSSARGRTDLVFMAIFVIIIISILFDYITKSIVKKVFKWRYLNVVEGE